MKRIYILLIIMMLFISLSSCQRNYEFTDNKIKISYGDINVQTIAYHHYDINSGEYVDDLYYYNNDIYMYSDAKLYIGMVNNDVKGKFTICRIIYNPVDFSISGVEGVKTYIVNPHKAIALKLHQGFSYYQGSEYLSYQEVIQVYDGYDIYIELVK